MWADQGASRVILEDGDMMTIAKDLYYAPFALLYHNSFEAPEKPVVQYANQVHILAAWPPQHAEPIQSCIF